MNELSSNSATDSKRDSSNVFLLAVTVGFIVFLLAGSFEGGLTDGQGFIVGFLSTIFLFVVAEILAHHQTQAYKQRQEYTNTLATRVRPFAPYALDFGQQQWSANLPATVTITPMENESGVTIRIYVNNNPAPSREIRNG